MKKGGSSGGLVIFAGMKIQQGYTFLLLFICKFFSYSLHAQEIPVRLEWSNAPISLNDSFTLTIVIEASDKREVSGFPTIPGFVRRGTHVTSATSTIAGQTTVVHRVSQRYLPTREGSFRVEPFTMIVNGEPLHSEGFTVVVAAPTTEGEGTEAGPPDPDATLEFEGVTADAFLSLRAQPTRIYVGEGFTVRLSLLVAASNPTPLNFYQLDAQLAELLKQLRPANCWEENFGIRGEPQEFDVLVNGKRYREYRLFEAVYFPFTAQPIRFPALSLRLLEGTEQQPRTFRSQPVAIRPQPLPRPVPDAVTVGNFQLRESLSTRQGRTGQSVTYTLRVIGEGHLDLIRPPEPEANASFDFYSPDISRAINHRNGQVSGEVTFRFQIIPKRAGTFPLSPYFRWTYFNPRLRRYQTLTSRLTLRVSGETLTDAALAGSAGSGLYQGIERLDTSRPYTDYPALIKGLANGFLGVMLLGIIVLFWRGKVR